MRPLTIKGKAVSGTATVRNMKMDIVTKENNESKTISYYATFTISNFGSSNNDSDMDLSLESQVKEQNGIKIIVDELEAEKAA